MIWPLPSLDHRRQDGLDRLGHADQIHVERLAERRRFELGDQRERPDAGARDQDLDRPERGRDVGHRRDQARRDRSRRPRRGDGASPSFLSVLRELGQRRAASRSISPSGIPFWARAMAVARPIPWAAPVSKYGGFGTHRVAFAIWAEDGLASGTR